MDRTAIYQYCNKFIELKSFTPTPLTSKVYQEMKVTWNIDLKRKPTSEQNIVDSIKLNQILVFETNT